MNTLLKNVEECPLELKYVPDHFKKQEMCDNAVEADPCKLDYIPDHFKTQLMCDKAVRREHTPLNLCLIILQHKKCVTMQCVTTQQHFFLFLTVLKHKKCISRLLRKIHGS